MWLKHGQQCHICHNQNALKICAVMESSNFVFGPLQLVITLELNKQAQHTLVLITILTSKVMAFFLKQNQFNNKSIWKVSSNVISINKVHYFIADLVGTRIVYIGDGVGTSHKTCIVSISITTNPCCIKARNTHS